MYCPSCGEEVEEGTAFCQHCGARIEDGETATGRQPTAKTSTGPAAEAPVERSGGTGVGGLEPNLAGALSYLVGFITGVIFLLIEEDDEFVRYHAAQSTVVFGGLFVLIIGLQFFGLFVGLLGLSFILWPLIWLAWMILALVAFVLWIFLMVKAYQGETPRIPVAANVADDLV